MASQRTTDRAPSHLTLIENSPESETESGDEDVVAIAVGDDEVAETRFGKHLHSRTGDIAFMFALLGD